MNPQEQNYLDLLSKLIAEGDKRIDRTGVGTKAIFGNELRFDLSQGFPAMTTKQVFWKTAFKEMLWFLSGGKSLRSLLGQNVHIWSEWPHANYIANTGDNLSLKDFESKILADEEFSSKWGVISGGYDQWRTWRTEDGEVIDQLPTVIDLLKNNPTSRRILWEGWNVGTINKAPLPPCHKTYQFFVSSDGHLSGACQIRSWDVFLGGPFNICGLALVIHLLSEQCGYTPGEAIVYSSDTHLYINHLEQAKEQISREPRPFPRLVIKRKPKSFFDYTIEDFELEGYDPHPAIKADVAV